MGTHFPFLSANPYSRRKAALAASAAALALSSCISDGSNQTGGDYLKNHGLVLQNPLYHVVIPEFPVDSIWTSDLEPAHYFDSTLLLGRWGKFESQVRMGFDVADSTFLDNLAGIDSLSAHTLKLSLGFPRFAVGQGFLYKSLLGRDSIKVAVHAWAISDSSEEAKKVRADTLNKFGKRFLVNQDTVPWLDRPPVSVDTIVLAVQTIYKDTTKAGKDSLQAGYLPALRKKLLERTNARWAVFLQLTPIYGKPADTGGAMLRLGGTTGIPYMPALFFGPDSITSTKATKPKKADPLILASTGSRGLNYRLRYAGPEGYLLTGKTKGMHIHLNRAALMDTLQRLAPRALAAGSPFDLAYFVPYAAITLPVDSLRMEGDFALDIRLQSDLDSLLPGNTDHLTEKKVALGAKETTIMYTYDRNNPKKITDSLTLTYRVFAGDSGLRRIVLHAKDTTTNDTLVLSIGQTKEHARALPGQGTNKFSLTFKAGAAELSMVSYINSQALIENSGVLDPVTGNPKTEVTASFPHLLWKGKPSVNLRASQGMQRLLNRAESGIKFFPDFFVQPVQSGAVDTTLKEKRNVYFPVMAEIVPKLQAGKLKVGLDLYLFPLRER